MRAYPRDIEFGARGPLTAETGALRPPFVLIYRSWSNSHAASQSFAIEHRSDVAE